MESLGEYVGAASMIDIVHHAYLGSGMRVMSKNRRYRVLFAQYFSPRMVANLVSFSLQRMNAQIHIVVATNDKDILEALTHTISSCGLAVGDEKVLLKCTKSIT